MAFLDWLFRKKQKKKVLLYHSSEEANSYLKENFPIEKIIEGKRILLIKTPQQIFAIENKCPHEGKKLTGGKCTEDYIICPFHKHKINFKTGWNETYKGSGRTQSFEIIKEEEEYYILIPN